MSASLLHSQAPPLEMRLVRTTERVMQPWGTSSISTDIASVPLSLDLRCVLCDDAGRALTHLDLGKMGISVHAAWDRAARDLLARHSSSEGVEFFIRPAPFPLPGVAGWEIAHARQWMAHPSTFTVLYRHLQSLTKPTSQPDRPRELSFVLRPEQEVAVYHCAPQHVRQALGLGSTKGEILRYSLGFPVVSKATTA